MTHAVILTLTIAAIDGQSLGQRQDLRDAMALGEATQGPLGAPLAHKDFLRRSMAAIPGSRCVSPQLMILVTIR